MNVLTGIQNFLSFINENWTMIASIITLGIIVFRKIKKYFGLSVDERVEIAKAQIKEIMLMLVTRAEVSYSEWVKSGEIKRAEVIDEVFTMYPILSKVSNQEEIIAWIDGAIDDALKTMRKILEENK
jgi:hypothetical protein